MVYRFLFLYCLMGWLAGLPLTARAQHEAFIYGRVETTTGQQYTGQIRWSAGQVYWGDFLFGLKTDIPVLQYLTEQQIENLHAEDNSNGFDWQFMNLWKTKYPERQHDLKIRFGDLAAIQVDGALKATLILKNGNHLKTATHPDDTRQLGKDIRVVDGRKGLVKVTWEEVVRVQFLPAPARVAHLNAIPLYGTVVTANGPVTGLIRWDRDEYLATHVLDGQADTGPPARRYAFGSILSIQARDQGALVKLESGEEVFLKNNRDVNAANRGILVLHPKRGLTLIKWSAFRSVTFTTNLPGDLGYTSFPKPNRLKATIQTTENRSYTSTFVFDLDEEWDMELLDGRHESGIQYWLPFDYIKSLKPRHEHATEVLLTDDKKLLLGSQYDVTNKNWGLMLTLPQARHRYLPWSSISLITFL